MAQPAEFGLAQNNRLTVARPVRFPVCASPGSSLSLLAGTVYITRTML